MNGFKPDPEYDGYCPHCQRGYYFNIGPLGPCNYCGESLTDDSPDQSLDISNLDSNQLSTLLKLMIDNKL